MIAERKANSQSQVSKSSEVIRLKCAQTKGRNDSGQSKIERIREQITILCLLLRRPQIERSK